MRVGWEPGAQTYAAPLWAYTAACGLLARSRTPRGAQAAARDGATRRTGVQRDAVAHPDIATDAARQPNNRCHIARRRRWREFAADRLCHRMLNVPVRSSLDGARSVGDTEHELGRFPILMPAPLLAAALLVRQAAGGVDGGAVDHRTSRLPVQAAGRGLPVVPSPTGIGVRVARLRARRRSRAGMHGRR